MLSMREAETGQTGPDQIIWRIVSDMMFGIRNSTQCRRRYNALKTLKEGVTLRTGAWCDEEVSW